MVPKAGLEPARLAPLPPQDSVSTKFHHFGTCIKIYTALYYSDCLTGCEPLPSVAGGVTGAGWAELSIGTGVSVTTDAVPVR